MGIDELALIRKAARAFNMHEIVLLSPTGVVGPLLVPELIRYYRLPVKLHTIPAGFFDGTADRRTLSLPTVREFRLTDHSESPAIYVEV